MSRFLMAVSVLAILSCNDPAGEQQPLISGEAKQWHKMELLFEGPSTSETDPNNPFLNYRMEVTFQKGNRSLRIPGFYAADGKAAETSASEGNKWKVIFCPDDFGIWTYEVVFRTGTNIAVTEIKGDGQKVAFDGYKGKLTIFPTDKTGIDLRARGRLEYAGEHYLKYAGTGEYFLKAGADSPENLLGYVDFDGTYYGGDTTHRPGEAKPVTTLHAYLPHLKDWKEGDPVWKNGKGKGLIGALNYLSSKKMNSVYMLLNNVYGDGKDVFPYTSYAGDFTRFDVSKLEQWEIVFSHMDQLGLMCHFVTQETENQLMLDSGKLGLLRKLYYREMIARFSHHLAVTWNLGEENGTASWQPNGQDDGNRRDMARYFKEWDPYQNFVVVHTHSGLDDRHRILDNLLGYPYLDGPSLQTEVKDVFSETLLWRGKSGLHGKKWVVNSDEIGPADTGAKPDKADPEHNEIRSQVLWGNLMAGGGGVEWYFGYKFPHNDLNCEDWRSRENLWDQTRHAIEFFRDHIPFYEMQNINERIQGEGIYGFAKAGEIYVFYLPAARQGICLSDVSGSFQVNWYDPVHGNFALPVDTIQMIKESNLPVQAHPVLSPSNDWVILMKKIKA